MKDAAAFELELALRSVMRGGKLFEPGGLQYIGLRLSAADT